MFIVLWLGPKAIQMKQDQVLFLYRLLTSTSLDLFQNTRFNNSMVTLCFLRNYNSKNIVCFSRENGSFVGMTCGTQSLIECVGTYNCGDEYRLYWTK